MPACSFGVMLCTHSSLFHSDRVDWQTSKMVECSPLNHSSQTLAAKVNVYPHDGRQKRFTLIKPLHVVTHTLISTLQMFWVVISSCCAVSWLSLGMLVRQSHFNGTIYKNTTVFLRRAVGNHANDGFQQTHRHCLVGVYICETHRSCQ